MFAALGRGSVTRVVGGEDVAVCYAPRGKLSLFGFAVTAVG